MSPSAERHTNFGSFTELLIDHTDLHQVIVYVEGNAKWKTGERTFELQNTSEERRILYTTIWVAANQQRYEYIETLFLNKGQSDFVEKRIRFEPIDDTQVRLSAKTLTGSQSFINQIQNTFGGFVNSINDVILVTKAEPTVDDGPRVLFVNHAFERMTGYTPKEIIGKTPKILQGPDTKESAKQEMRNAFRDWQQIYCQLDNYTKDGKHFVVELHITPLKDAIGWWTHWISLQRDVTERIANEQKLLKQEALLLRKSRLASIGEISSSVFHEVYNLLTILIGHLHMLNDNLDERDLSQVELKKAFSKMLIAGRRMEDILGGIRKLSRNATREEPMIFSINQELDQVVSLVQPLYVRDGIEFSYNDDCTEAKVTGNPGKFQQLVLNLLSNARDATETAAQKAILVDVAAVNHRVQICIQNSGDPIPESLREKIFQPFFTTKGNDEGTGLGLSIVRQFATEMHGKVEYQETEVGSKFILSLPIAD